VRPQRSLSELGCKALSSVVRVLSERPMGQPSRWCAACRTSQHARVDFQPAWQRNCHIEHFDLLANRALSSFRRAPALRGAFFDSRAGSRLRLCIGNNSYPFDSLKLQYERVPIISLAQSLHFLSTDKSPTAPGTKGECGRNFRIGDAIN
jgi:hypothetical protein